MTVPGVANAQDQAGAEALFARAGSLFTVATPHEKAGKPVTVVARYGDYLSELLRDNVETLHGAEDGDFCVTEFGLGPLHNGQLGHAS